MCTIEEIKQKVRKLCDLREYKDDEEIISNCMQIIEKYLSFEGSSLDVVNYHLQNSLDNGAWILAWKGIKEETDRLTGDYYKEQEKIEQEQQRILLDYHPLDLGERFLTEKQIAQFQTRILFMQNLKLNNARKIKILRIRR